MFECIRKSGTRNNPAASSLTFSGRPRRGRAVGARSGISEAHIHRDSANALQQVIGNGGQLLRSHTERWPRYTHGCNRLALPIQKRYCNTAQALFQFFVIHGVAAAACLLYLCPQSIRGTDCTMGEPFKSRAADDLVDPVLG